jgi:hypothetical protein
MKARKLGTTPWKLYHYRYEAMTSHDVPTVTSLESCYKDEDENLLQG